MIVYVNKITSRFQYVSDFIGEEVLGRVFELTSDAGIFKNYNGPKINYGDSAISNEEFRMEGRGLLFETGTKEQSIQCFEINNCKAFFKAEGDYPFDIFAAAFYLLSRYEEYLPHQKDKYGRYAHENSFAFRQGFLSLPLINIWIDDFKRVLKEKYPTLNVQHSTFKFESTYDIDEAFSYRHKGFVRTAGGIARQLVTGDWKDAKKRVNAIGSRVNDPYDAYDWINELHKLHNLQPIYFFHVAAKNGKYDRNILPSQLAMQWLIKQHADKYSVGVHPSWQSGDDPALIKKEIETLENITGKKITSSRQHYIRFTLPQTFRQLIDSGITDDYSMGYGGINGFRASTASPFYWYDLEKEETTSLRLHPFCWMDSTAFYQQQLNPQQALEEIGKYLNTVKSVNGKFISIWHNNFLGTDPLLKGWKEVYEQFIANS